MIVSMTGCGDASHEHDGISRYVEIRSLNNRFFKAVIRLPEHLQFLEPQVERQLRSRLGRGSINYYLRLQQDTAEAAYRINTAVVEAYIDALKRIVAAGTPVTMDLATMLTLPGVCQPPELDEVSREKEWAIIERLNNEAVERLLEMRRAEGQAMHDDLLANCGAIRTHLEAIEQRTPMVVEDYRRKLQNRVGLLLADTSIELHEDMLVREVAVYADRCDISEEVSRLHSHLDQFVELCDGTELAGRRLDFLTQEMLRESNTIGSKANDATISRSVVEIKNYVDRLREQVQNVE
jgi:uncharacterized protein (TIGR00255 family)